MKILLAADASAASEAAVREVAAGPWPMVLLRGFSAQLTQSYTWNAPGLKEAC
jgi:hypothetical protein